MKTTVSPHRRVRQFFRERFKEDAERAMDESAVLDLVRRHEISPAFGAELLNMYVGDFVDLMARRGVPYFTEPPRPMEELLAHYRAAHQR